MEFLNKEIMERILNKYSNNNNEESETYQLLKQDLNITTTENGDKAYLSTLNPLVDLYYESLRNVNLDKLKLLFNEAWKVNPYYTMRLIAHIRDIRNGKGERELGKHLYSWVYEKSPEIAEMNAKHFYNTFGRWDDGMVFKEVNKKNKTKKIESSKYLEMYIQTVVNQLEEDIQNLQENKSISLCAKWIPSEKSSNGYIYKMIAKKYGYKYDYFRRNIVAPLRRKLELLETKMCKKEYSSIEYEKVPSVAMNKHSKIRSKKGILMDVRKKNGLKGDDLKENAFLRNDKTRFLEYKENLKSGKSKINASILYPHIVVNNYVTENGKFKSENVDDLYEAQWNEIVKKMESLGTLNETLVLSDVSGSMDGIPMLISYSLGLLISSLSKSEVWRNMVMTFESNPQWVNVSGETLYERLGKIVKAPWGGSTNFVKAYELILEMCVKYKLSQDDVPKRLIVISDMQFDSADSRMNNSSFEEMKLQFNIHGYEMPQMVFWNVRSTDTKPVLSDVKNVCLVSGYSPNVLKSVIESNYEDVTPINIVMKAIMDSRYDIIRV